MTRPTVLLSMAFVSIALASPALAQTDGAPSRITAQEIDAHLRFLSSDLLEGRAPATRGGQLAEQYIASELMSFGVKPEYRPDFDLTGATQLADIVYRFGLSLGNARMVPTWNADAEFKALPEGTRSGQ